MKIILTKNEVASAEEMLRKLSIELRYLVSPSDSDKTVDEFIDELYESVDSKFDEDGNLVFEIKEGFVCEYFAIIGDFYKLAAKVAKIIIPTVELVISSCQEDMMNLIHRVEKLEELLQ